MESKLRACLGWTSRVSPAGREALARTFDKPPWEVMVMEPSWLRSGFSSGARLLEAWFRLIRPKADPAVVTRAIAEAEDHALAAEGDAAILECVVASGDNLQTLAPRFALIEHHAEDLFADVDRLKILQGRGERWQVDTVYFVRPLLYSLACQLDSAAHRFDSGEVSICNRGDVTYLHGVSELAGRTASLVHDLVEWGRDNAEVDLLHRQLTSPTPPAA